MPNINSRNTELIGANFDKKSSFWLTELYANEISNIFGGVRVKVNPHLFNTASKDNLLHVSKSYDMQDAKQIYNFIIKKFTPYTKDSQEAMELIARTLNIIADVGCSIILDILEYLKNGADSSVSGMITSGAIFNQIGTNSLKEAYKSAKHRLPGIKLKTASQSAKTYKKDLRELRSYNLA